MTSIVFIGIGSNIEPEKNITAAIQLMIKELQILQISNFYKSKAVGDFQQPAFINGVVKITTDLQAKNLKFDVLRKIESQLGRKRTSDKYAPRTIDLDILVYDECIINESDLLIPDPEINKRPFIAIPVFEVDPELIIPRTDIHISEIAREMTGYPMQRLDGFTSLLRSELEIESQESRTPD